MSIPVTMRALHSRLEEITSAPLSPSRLATAEAINDHWSPSSAAGTDANTETATLSQSASVPEDGVGVPGSACGAMSVAKSELLPEINSSPSVNP